MKIRLSHDSQPPPNEPVLVFLDGQAMAPGIDYTLTPGDLPEFLFEVSKSGGRPTIVMLVSRIPYQAISREMPIPTPMIHPPVIYKIQWENGEYVAYSMGAPSSDDPLAEFREGR